MAKISNTPGTLVARLDEPDLGSNRQATDLDSLFIAKLTLDSFESRLSQRLDSIDSKYQSSPSFLQKSFRETSGDLAARCTISRFRLGGETSLTFYFEPKGTEFRLLEDYSVSEGKLTAGKCSLIRTDGFVQPCPSSSSDNNIFQQPKGLSSSQDLSEVERQVVRRGRYLTPGVITDPLEVHARINKLLEQCGVDSVRLLGLKFAWSAFG